MLKGPQNRFELLGKSQDSSLLTPAIETMTSHATVRRYEDRPLPAGLLDAIVIAAQSAATSSNKQLYSIISVEDQTKKDRLATLCNNQEQVAQCSTFMVFCADLYRLERVCQRQGYPMRDASTEIFLQAVVDAALAGQNAAVAAESHGLGTCMIGGIRDHPQEIAAVLDLPHGVFALFGLCVGYPAEPVRVKPRLPQSVVHHREHYSSANLESGLVEYDRTMVATGIYQGRQASQREQDRHEVEQYGWCEHTARRLANPHPHRTDIKRTLEAMGFNLS